jgi:hypothetical protein
MSVDDVVTTDEMVRTLMGEVERALRTELSRRPPGPERQIRAEVRHRPGATLISIELTDGERADEEETEGRATAAPPAADGQSGLASEAPNE